MSEFKEGDICIVTSDDSGFVFKGSVVRLLKYGGNDDWITEHLIGKQRKGGRWFVSEERLSRLDGDFIQDLFK